MFLGDPCTRRDPLTFVTLLKGLITQERILRTQFRVLITLLITRGPFLVGPASEGVAARRLASCCPEGWRRLSFIKLQGLGFKV